jgi:hypothetical protein
MREELKKNSGRIPAFSPGHDLRIWTSRDPRIGDFRTKKNHAKEIGIHPRYHFFHGQILSVGVVVIRE